MGTPTISIIIAAFNEEATLSQAIESINRQSFKDFEVILIDDGSIDKTHDAMKKRPSAVPLENWHIIKNSNNQGLAASLNNGLKIASGQYIARLDADDSWHPEKLAKQVAILKAHPKIGVVGTWYYNQRGKQRKKITVPVSDMEIRRNIYRKNPFGHSAVIFKRTLVNQFGGYNEKLRFAQDRELWYRLMPHTEFYNLPEYLVTRSISHKNQSPAKKLKQISTSMTITKHYMDKYKAPLYTKIFLIEPYLIKKYYALRQKYDNFSS